MTLEHEDSPATIHAPGEAPGEPLKQARIAEARARTRAENEANMTVRKCLGCEDEFHSEGIHNRLCRRCRSRR